MSLYNTTSVQPLGDTVNLEELRRLADQPNADPVVIEKECVLAMALRPTTIAEHAELLYLYTEAQRALHQQASPRVFELAQRARQLAQEADLPFIAIRAGFIALHAASVAKLCTKEAFEHGLASLRKEREEAAQQGNLLAQESAFLAGLLQALEIHGLRHEQRDGFAAV